VRDIMSHGKAAKKISPPSAASARPLRAWPLPAVVATER
jgi:hypothetical protein